MYNRHDMNLSKPIPLEDRLGSPRAHSPRAAFSEELSKENSSERNTQPPLRKPDSSNHGAARRQQGSPLTPLHANPSTDPTSWQSRGRSTSFEVGDDAYMGASENLAAPPEARNRLSDSGDSFHAAPGISLRPRTTVESPQRLPEPQTAILYSGSQRVQIPYTGGLRLTDAFHSRKSSGGSSGSTSDAIKTQNVLPSHRKQSSGDSGTGLGESRPVRPYVRHTTSEGPSIISNGSNSRPPSSQLLAPRSQLHLASSLPRPASAYSSASELRSPSPGRTRSPQYSPYEASRGPSPDSRPISYIDLLNVPYPQPPPAPANFNNAQLRDAVGNNASLLGTKKTLDMYRANVKKTNDPTIQYEFAVFMINAAQEVSASEESEIGSQPELLREARHILQRLSDRSYPFAQYYLADGYASGLFNKGIEDYDRAFHLFVAASKHGHAEAGYRAALCYEFGWGTRKDVQKAVQFYRQAASKNHPGAMSRLGRACLIGDMGLGNRYREGLKWLKRAAESADFQYNSAPYELGLLHETGYGDDIFRDESYAAQLFTQSADLGHVEANYRLGDAYEHGKLSCPKDPALSVHFYTGAAQRGHPLGMMALCAWYMVGAEPVLEKDENEAYEWAKRAAETGIPSAILFTAPLSLYASLTYAFLLAGLPKAQYAVGYFTEMGIGCRRDPLEANVWYVRAADQGDERAKHRIAAIRAAASGGDPTPARRVSTPGSGKRVGKEEDGGEKKGRRWGIF